MRTLLSLVLVLFMFMSSSYGQCVNGVCVSSSGSYSSYYAPVYAPAYGSYPRYYAQYEGPFVQAQVVRHPVSVTRTISVSRPALYPQYRVYRPAIVLRCD